MCPVCGTLLELAESPQATREKAFIENRQAGPEQGRNHEALSSSTATHTVL